MKTMSEMWKRWTKPITKITDVTAVKVSEHQDVIEILESVLNTVNVNAVVTDTVKKRILIRTYALNVHELARSLYNTTDERREHRVNAVSLNRFFESTIPPSECLQRLVNGVRSVPKLSIRIRHDIINIAEVLSENK